MARERGRASYPENLARALGPCRRAVEAERREREANERLEVVLAFREQLDALD
jgi:hypothetical protein